MTVQSVQALPSQLASVTSQLGTQFTLDSLGLLDTEAEIARWKAEGQAEKQTWREEQERPLNAESKRPRSLEREMNSNLHFAPVPVAKVVNAENVVRLYLMVRKKGITPTFEFENVGLQTFNAVLKINGQVFTADGPYQSKKEAKEAAAKLGVDYLNGNPNLSSTSSEVGSGPSDGPKDVADLYHLVQKYKLAPPEYRYDEVSKGQFSVTLVLANETFAFEGPYPTKKLAKEAISEVGVWYLSHEHTPAISSVELTTKLYTLADRHRLDAPILDILELEGTAYQYRAQLRLDSVIFMEDGPFQTKEEAKCTITKKAIEHLERKYIVEDEQNWIELLSQFSQSSNRWTPIYTDFQETSTKQGLWASEVIIPLRAEPFGRRDLPFGSKKKAHQNAAREAMMWLREQGLVSEDGPPKTIQKGNLSSASAAPPGSDSSRQEEISYAQQVHDICVQNSINVPSYELKAAPEGPFYSGFARFMNSPDIACGQPIGHVESIYGQKKAKEAVARNILRYLDEYVKEQAKLD